MFSVYVTVEKYILLKTDVCLEESERDLEISHFAEKCLYGRCRKSVQVWVEYKLVEDQYCDSSTILLRNHAHMDGSKNSYVYKECEWENILQI